MDYSNKKDKTIILKEKGKALMKINHLLHNSNIS
jgi:hypothetical protein